MPGRLYRADRHVPRPWASQNITRLGVELVSRAYRHVYGETLGTWRAADLLIGLAYLARRDPPGGSVLQDIATAGTPYGAGLRGAERIKARVRAAACP